MSEKTIAGRYQLLEPLDREGDWLAEDSDLGRRVRLRLLVAHGEPFEASARAAASLAHPHIARLYDYGESDGVPFAVAEFLPGGSLETRVETGGPLPAEDADAVARDVAAALAYAHAQGVPHGDLGPASVQFDPEGRAKVTDFGTASGTRASTAADVAAFGALGFLMLTGRQADDPSTLARLRPDAPPALVATVLAALGVAGAAARPVDGAALVELLGPAAPAPPRAPAERPTEILAPIAPPAAPRRRGSAAVLILALLALLGAGAAAAFLVGGDGADTTPLPSLSVPRVSTASTASTASAELTDEPATSVSETTTEATTSTAETTSTAPTTTRPATTTTQAPLPTTTAPPPTTEPLPPPPPTEDTSTVPIEPPTTETTTEPAP